MTDVLVMQDSAWPLPVLAVPSVTVIAGYLPGLTPHAWTAADWAEARQLLADVPGYLLPIFVPDPTKFSASQAVSDVASVIAQLKGFGFAGGAVVALDIEAGWANDPGLAAYVATWWKLIVVAGYVPMGYTSAGTKAVFAGWPDEWLAHYTSVPHLELGSVATQYEQTQSYDLSEIEASLPLQPAHSLPAPTASPAAPADPPAYLTEEESQNMLAYDPETGGTWALRPDGAVYADDGAPYLGGLNNHPEYHAGAGEPVGPAVGIAPYGKPSAPPNERGYEILCSNPSGPEPARYRFPRDESLVPKAAA